jgi:hypothetical protein
LTLSDLLTTVLGEKGQVALAGAAGGLVRWLTLRSRPLDGFIAVVVGALSATYLGPLAEPAIDALLGNIIVEETSRGAFSGFILGLGGITVTGFVMDFWKSRNRKRDDDDG